MDEEKLGDQVKAKKSYFQVLHLLKYTTLYMKTFQNMS